MPRPTETKLREAFALAEYELSGDQLADERGMRIFELRASGIKSFHEIARKIGGVSHVEARRLYDRELKRRIAERPDLIDSNLEEILVGLDASARRLNRLLEDVEEDTELTIGQRVFAVTKLEEQLRKVDESRRKLLALDAPDRLAVLVGDVGAGPTPEELDAMSVEEIQERLAKQKQLRQAVVQQVVEQRELPPKPANPSEAVLESMYGVQSESATQSENGSVVAGDDASSASNPEAEAERSADRD